jgi:hypothetical protein
MATLHIEHRISDYTVWRSAFDRFADIRQQAGVRGHRVLRPVDDPTSIVVELDFDTPAEAEAFRTFLQEKVWPSPDRAPALVGAARTSILELLES